MSDGLASALATSVAGSIVADAAFVQLHTGPPGADGTANVSSVTTREAQAWGDAADGEAAATGTPEWDAWAGTDGEEVTDISHWSLDADGDFEFSVQLDNPVTMHTGDALELASDTVTLPVAS